MAHRGRTEIGAVLRLIGAHVRKERFRTGLTQERLARALKLSTNYIAHLERGSRGASWDTLVQLANFFRVPIQRFLELPEPKHPGPVPRKDRRR